MDSEKSDKLVSQIAALYAHEASKDIGFRLNDTDDIMNAHKTILAARSEVFMAMFFGPLKEKQVNFT